ncbi:CotH kinase family protein [candidate division KSB1 bacterium]|nr:CotH kinase family protein [candidate division KSB1 bacterium]
MKKISFYIVAFLLTAEICLPAGEIFINEFMASNVLTLGDERDNYNDWIEIYNAMSTSVNLAGYYLSDDKDNLTKWKFPSDHTAETTIPAGGFMLIWADEEQDEGPLHTNFKLAKSGEHIFLVEADGSTIVDDIVFPEQETDISFGRYPDASANLGYMPEPSPNAANNMVYTVFTERPVIKQQAGFYSSPVTVTIEPGDNAESIYYTLDGSVPDLNSAKYAGPVTIDSTCILSARAFRDGYGPGLVTSRSFFINTIHSLPVVSIITDPKNLFDDSTGIYTNSLESGRKWERKVDVEFFQEEQEKFRITSGLRIQGNTGREMEKKSFRLYFREEFGNDRLEYPMFENTFVKSFKNLVLRAGYDDDLKNYNGTLLRDPLTNEFWRRLGFLTSHSKLAVLYLNGQFWGIYDIRESVNEHFISDYYFYNDMDIIRYRWTNWELVYGSSADFTDTINFFKTNDLYTDEQFAKAADLIDIDNFTAIQVLSHPTEYHSWTYGASMFKAKYPGAKWQWTLWDMDRAYASSNWNGFSRYDDPSGEYWPNIITQKLLHNQSYRDLLVNRISDVLNTLFIPGKAITVLDSLANSIRPDIHYELQRWDAKREDWDNNVEILRTKIRNRPGIVRDQMKQYFQLGDLVNIIIEAPAGKGYYKINTLKIDTFPWTGKYYSDVPVEIKAVPAAGYTFAGWADSQLPTDPEIRINPVEGQVVSANFKKLGETNTELIAPPRVRSGSILPVVARIRDMNWEIDDHKNSAVKIQIDQTTLDTTFNIQKGAGSIVLPVDYSSGFSLKVKDSNIAEAQKNITVNNNYPVQTYSGQLSEGEVHWTADKDRLIAGDLTVPENLHLIIEPGTCVYIKKYVDVIVRGRITVNGNAENPVVFISENRDEPWGGFEFYNTRADFRYCFFVNSGGNPDKGWAHTNRQPILFARDNSELNLNNCYLLNSPGKGLCSHKSIVNVSESLSAFIFHGGELHYTLLNCRDSYIMNIPNDDGVFEDKDSDGYYIAYMYPGSDEYSVIDNCYFITGKDDAIDHHGARLKMTNCWIDGWMHEGVAASGLDTIRVCNTVVQNCDQGIESGWTNNFDIPGPNVFVDHCVLINNDTGLRFGDGYNSQAWTYNGHITATNSIIYNNQDNIRNYINPTQAPVEGAIDISFSMTNDTDYNDYPYCISGTPQFDEDYYLLPGTIGTGKGKNGSNMGLFDFEGLNYGAVVITEIMYNTGNDIDSGDWIELYNPQSVSQNLSGWIIKDNNNAHSFYIPDGTVLPPDSLLVICENVDDFRMIYPNVRNIIGNTGFGLGRSDQVRLYSTIMQSVDSVAFENKAPWPVMADGYGYSLSLKSIQFDNSVGNYWEASLEKGGTPGRINGAGMADIERDNIPSRFDLKQNYPNPFNAYTTINYDLPDRAHVTLFIYNIMGQKVKELVNVKNQPGGNYSVVFDAGQLASGVYFYQLNAEFNNGTRNRITRKLLLIK